MSSIVARRYISTDVKNLGGGYREPSIITTRIPHHIDDHFMRPNMVAFKYFDLKKIC
jgi:hypothetical protein